MTLEQQIAIIEEENKDAEAYSWKSSSECDTAGEVDMKAADAEEWEEARTGTTNGEDLCRATSPKCMFSPNLTCQVRLRPLGQSNVYVCAEVGFQPVRLWLFLIKLDVQQREKDQQPINHNMQECG
jgi:hypothetical protein